MKDVGGVGAERRNVTANYANFTVSALVGLAINPLLLSSLGPIAFGAWKACQRFVDFASVADGRASQALKWIIAYRSAGESSVEQSRRAMTGAVVVWGLSLPILGLASTALIIALPSVVTGTSDISADTLRQLALILCLNVILSGLLRIPDSVLVGMNIGYRSTHVTTVCFVATNVAMAAAAIYGHGILILAAITVAGAISNGIATYCLARRSLPWWGFSRPERADVVGITRFSGWTLSWELIAKLMISSEIILLSILTGAASVAAYTFTSYLAQFALSICLLTTSAAMPRLGKLIGGDEREAASRLAKRVREQNIGLAVVVAGTMLLLNRSFVELWAGPEMYLGDAANILMVLGLLQLVSIRNNAQIQDTGLQIGSKVGVGAASVALSLGLGYLAYRLSSTITAMFIGITLGRTLASFALPVLIKKIVPDATIALRSSLSAALIVGFAASIGLLIDITTIWTFLILAPMVAGLLAVLTYFTVLTHESRQSSLQMVGLRASKSSM